MEEKQSINGPDISYFYVYIFIVVFLWVIYQITMIFVYPEIQKASEFGDSFGALNTLFAGLAFAGIIYTIQLQRKELTLQRQELKLTRKELNRSAEAQEKAERALNEQAKILERTSKLNALNILIEYYTSIINSLEHNSDKWRIAVRKRKHYIKTIENFISKSYNNT